MAFKITFLNRRIFAVVTIQSVTITLHMAIHNDFLNVRYLQLYTDNIDTGEFLTLPCEKDVRVYSKCDGLNLVSYWNRIDTLDIWILRRSRVSVDDNANLVNEWFWKCTFRTQTFSRSPCRGLFYVRLSDASAWISSRNVSTGISFFPSMIWLD